VTSSISPLHSLHRDHGDHCNDHDDGEVADHHELQTETAVTVPPTTAPTVPTPPAPRLPQGRSSRSALYTVGTVEPLKMTRFDRVSYDALSQRIRKKQRHGAILPKLVSNLNVNRKRRRLEMERKEEDEFVAKSAVNAPILILAHCKRRRKWKGNGNDDALSTFRSLCLEKGYRVQNVLFEWDFEIWIVKA